MVPLNTTPTALIMLHQKHEKVKQFLEKNQEKMRFSIAPVIEIEKFEGSDPLDNEYYQAMVALRDQNLADTLNARVFENAEFIIQ